MHDTDDNGSNDSDYYDYHAAADGDSDYFGDFDDDYSNYGYDNTITITTNDDDNCKHIDYESAIRPVIFDAAHTASNLNKRYEQQCKLSRRRPDAKEGRLVNQQRCSYRNNRCIRSVTCLDWRGVCPPPVPLAEGVFGIIKRGRRYAADVAEPAL